MDLTKENVKYIFTGNIMKTGCLMSEPLAGVAKELQGALEATLIRASKQQSSDSMIIDHEFIHRLTEDLPNEHEVSAKVFFYNTLNSFDELKEILSLMKDELRIHKLESVVLSFVDQRITEEEEEDDHLLHPLTELWLDMEHHCHEDHIKSAKHFGVSNLSLDQLKKLIQMTKMKPAVNQVRIPCGSGHCPKDLVSYGKEVSVAITTHNDPKNILSHEVADSLLKAYYSYDCPVSYKIDWIARYQYAIKCRSISSNKGYIVKLTTAITA